MPPGGRCPATSGLPAFGMPCWLPRPGVSARRPWEICLSLAELQAALDRSLADVVAGRTVPMETVPMETVLDELEASIERMERGGGS